MRRNILKINYDDSNFSIWFDGTHGEIITGIAIVIKGSRTMECHWKKL